jgi:hypothetical protein
VTRFIEKYPRYNEKQTKNPLKSNRKIVERKIEATVMYLCVRGHVFVLEVMYLCVRGHVFVC